jgi:hypothetical protein
MAQFPFDVLDVDWPRPRLVRCVSRVTTTEVLATGAFDADDAEAVTAGGAASEPEYTLVRWSAEAAGLAGGRTEEGDLGACAGKG